MGGSRALSPSPPSACLPRLPLPPGPCSHPLLPPWASPRASEWRLLFGAPCFLGSLSSCVEPHRARVRVDFRQLGTLHGESDRERAQVIALPGARELFVPEASWSRLLAGACGSGVVVPSLGCSLQWPELFLAADLAEGFIKDLEGPRECWRL